MTELRIQTLGGFRLIHDGQEIPRLERQPVRAALLVYLAMEREARRDTLVHLLWPERDEKDGRHNLNQTIYGLRQLLGGEGPGREGDVVRLGAGVSVDALDLEVAVGEGDWSRAIELYEGPFLASTSFSDSAPFQEWSESVRARLVRLARSAWRGAFESPTAVADVEEGIRLARLWVHHDPLEDEAQHTLLEQLARAGRRAELLDAYERYARLLEDELELEPLEHTKALVEAVRSGTGVPGMELSATSTEAAVAVSPRSWAAPAPRPADAPPPALAGSARRTHPVTWGLGIAVLLTALAVAAVFATRTFGRKELLAFDLNPPRGVMPTQAMVDAAISPDGSDALLSGTDTAGVVRLWVRSIRTSDVRPVPGTERGHTPLWSPDGQRIGYFANAQLWISSLRGDRPQSVARVAFDARGASWGSRDVVLFAPDSRTGLRALDLDEGTERQITTPDRARGEIGHEWPSFLPDGEHFLYLVTSDREDVQGIYLASLSDPEGRMLVRASGNALYRAGRLLFFRDRSVYAQPFDARSGRLRGMAEPLVSGVAASFTHQAAFSGAVRSDVLIYSADSLRAHSRLQTLSAKGESLGFDTPPQHQRNPALSPDGRHVAVELYDGTDSQILVVDRATGGERILDDGGAQVYFPTWSPAGDRIVYSAVVPEGWALRVWDLRSSGAPKEIRVFDHEIDLAQWIDAGVVFHERDATDVGKALLIDVDDPGDPRVILAGSRHRLQAQVSPSGDHIAYVADDSGFFQVYVETFPTTGRRCQVSTTGGFEPQWGTIDGTLHFIDHSGNLVSVSVDPGDGCAEALPALLAPRVVEAPLTAKNHYVVDRTTGAFIVNRYADPGRNTISALVNWPLALPSRQR